MDPRKCSFSPAFRFLLEGHKACYDFVSEMGFTPRVSAEYLFHNVVVHSIDHKAAYRCLSSLHGAWSFDGSGTLRSYVQSLVFYYFWVPPQLNLFEEERVSHTGLSFYKKLYARLSVVDPVRCNDMITSCSF
jgi:hypothetical protein